MTFKTRLRRKIKRNLENAPRGGNGIYIQLSKKRDVKILRSEYATLEDLLLYSTHIQVYQEARAMKMAKRLYSYIPECYGVKMFKVNGFYTIGIFIQHLGNTRISDIMTEPYPKCHEIEKELLKVGIHHNDIHSHNIMYFKRKYWVIDFAHVRVTPKT